jgi:hypothetical protein
MAAETRSSQGLTFDGSPLYLAELAVPLGYIFVTSHALIDIANALPGAGRR